MYKESFFLNLIRQTLYKLRQNQLFKDSFWSLGGNVVGKGLALLAGILVARFLGKDIYGEYGIIRNTILTIGVFSTFGLGYTATKYIANYKREKPEYIKLFIHYATKITLIFSGLMSVLLFVFSEDISVEVFGAEHLTLPLRYLAFLIVFNAITTTQIGILSGFGKFKLLAKINSFVGVLTFLLSVVLTYYWHFEGALLALLIAQIANCVFNFCAVRGSIPKNIPFVSQDKQMQSTILKFSTPIALQEAVYAMTSWFSSILLVRYASFGELGMYTAAMQWNAIILFIPGILRNVILSHLSAHSDNKQLHNKILRQTIQINFIATLIPCVFIFLFSKLIADSYGNSFVGLDSLICWAVLPTIFIGMSNVYVQAYMSKSANWLMSLFRIGREVLFLVLILFFFYFNMFDNKVLAVLLTNLLVYILFFIVVKFVFELKIQKAP